jgi:hypothetical protein
VAAGTWRYTVQALKGSWLGPESPLGSPITVGAATLTLPTTPITTLPATLPGSIANFHDGETLTFRLDGPTGPVLAGTPASVPAGGATAVSVTIPAGTNDSPHSVFAVGSGGSVAAAAVNVVDPPTLVSLAARDIDLDGRIDRVVATFDEALASYTAGVAPWTLANVPSGGSLATVTVAGSVATLDLTEGAGAPSTAVPGFTVALAANSAGIRDLVGHTASFGATAVADQAAPAPVSMTMQDVNANGKVDRVAITFSEAIVNSTATAPWTLGSVPSAGALASVAASGTTATLTITEGAGAVDTAVGPFTVTLATAASGIRDAVGNQASFSRSPSDGARPVRTASEMFDVNADGWVDRVVVTFSEALAPYTAGNGVWALTNAPSGATLAAVGVSGTQAVLDLAQGAGAATTAVGSFQTALAADPAGVRDAAGNQASYASVAPVDRAAPAALSVTMLDNDVDGRVDRVTATFSETLSTYSAGTTPWVLANVPSAGTLGSVNVAASTATLNITEGAGAVDTGVGSMTVRLDANAAGVRDAAGNLSSFAARTPSDGARPIVVSVTDTNGSTSGRIQAGDTVTFTFSEPLDPSTVPSSTTVSLTDPAGAGNDTLSITGILNGARDTGSPDHITTNNRTASFAASTVALSSGNRAVTVTVGPTCSGTGCGSIGTVLAATNLSVLAATTITDVAANLPDTTARTFSIRLF